MLFLNVYFRFHGMYIRFAHSIVNRPTVFGDALLKRRASSENKA